MAGWDLKEGKLSDEIVSEEKFWEIINSILENNKNTNIYKPILFQSLVSIFLKEKKEFINLDILAEEFYFLYKKIYLVNQDSLFYCKFNGKSKNTSMDLLMDKKNGNVNSLVKKILKTNVIGALYKDSENFLYSFDLKKEEIKINKKVFEKIEMNKEEIFILNIFKIIKLILTFNKIKEDKEKISIAYKYFKKIEGLSYNNFIKLSELINIDVYLLVDYYNEKIKESF
jgi:hypothetical protein